MSPSLHRSPVTAVDVREEMYVSGSYDGSVIKWDEAGTPLWKFTAGHLVNDVRFSPSGESIAVASADGFAYILSAETGYIRGKFGPHDDDVNAVAWSPDESQLAIVTDALSTDILLWNVKDVSIACVLHGQQHGVFAIEYSPSGDHLASAAEDGTVRIWTPSGELLRSYDHPGDPETVTWLDSTHVLSGCEDGQVRRWNINEDEVRDVISISSAAVRSVRNTPAGPVAVGSYDGVVTLLDPSTLAVTKRYEAPLQWERAATMTRAGTVIAGSFGDRPIVHGRGTHHLPSATFGINKVVGDRKLLVACLDSGEVVDVHSRRLIARHGSIVNTACIRQASTSEAYVYSGDYLGNVILSRRGKDDTWEETCQIRLSGGPVNALVFDDVTTAVIAANYAGEIITLSVDLDILDRRQAHDGPIKDILTVGGQIYSVSSDNTLRSHTVGGQGGFIARDSRIKLLNSVAYASQAGLLVTGSREGRVALWHADSGQLSELISGFHTRSVKCVCINVQATQILSSSYDNNAYLWKKSQGIWGALPLRWHTAPGVPTAVMDGSTIYLGGWDERLTTWTEKGFLECVIDMREDIPRVH